MTTEEIQFYKEEGLPELANNIKKQPRIESPIVFYGSSSFRLWTSVREDLNNDQILNMGFGGSTLEACALYFKELFSDIDQPQKIFIYAGDNDLGGGQQPSDILNSYNSLYHQIRERYGDVLPIVYLSIKPSPSKDNIQSKIEESNQLVFDEIKHQTNVTYVDIYRPMLNDNGNSRPDLFEDDMLHMRPEGYQVWIKALHEMV
ncbi:GDSL family lipase [Flammeovirga yaeyamensis]|uniref:GDSL family lipase n=1 Tax=Flammeovirga yaeyamensis TaxID=367791 RepID=A0AAX1N6T5_9BACT|nr:GDSL-type esterase/lipase family protein [Flammeovirga yaeyamensis]MBB3697501.1 lysophospholipase L1-like esterase [Flammeovirga yaeyamensis]NMF36195.1 GDSL family lipase [Flammeovirga yaeyamensis]QWG02927.1 GDSL family lipase [Flammeovirga yaeyamensis]